MRNHTGCENKAYTAQTARKLVGETRQRLPTQCIDVSLWHWPAPLQLPPFDSDAFIQPTINLRVRQMAGS